MKVKPQVTLLIFLLMVVFQIRADQRPTCNIVDQLQDGIYAYDWGEKLWLPVTADSVSSTLLGFTLELGVYRSLDLELGLPKGTSVYIDHKMVGYIWTESKNFWDLDSLSELYPDQSIFISFYNRNRMKPGSLSLNLCSDFELLGSTESDLQNRLREESAFTDFFIFAFFLVITFFVISFNRYPDFFKEFFSIQNMFALRIKKEENLLTGRPINPINLFFMIGYSLLIALLIMIGTYYLFESDFRYVNFNYSFFTFFGQWLILSLIILALVHIKYIFIWLLSNLFDLGKFSNSHFIDYIGMANIFYSGIFLVIGVTYFGWRYALVDVLKFLLPIVMIFMIVRIIVLFFKSLSVSTFQKLHLFSYLCTSELVPALIIIRFIGS